MAKLRPVRERVQDGEFEFDLRGLDGPLLKEAFPIAMLLVGGKNYRQLTERARAEGFNVDDNGENILIWDSHPSDGTHKVSTVNLFIFVLSVLKELKAATTLSLFQFNGLRMQLENGIFGINQAVETAARKAFSEEKGQVANHLYVAREATLYLSQSGFRLSSAENAQKISFSSLQSMKDTLRDEVTASSKRAKAA
jgi:hypothetical protein